MIIKEQFEKNRRAAFLELVKFLTDSECQFAVAPTGDGWQISYRLRDQKEVPL